MALPPQHIESVHGMGFAYALDRIRAMQRTNRWGREMLRAECSKSALLWSIALFLFTGLQYVYAQPIDEEGFASWYNRGTHGSRTASGEIYDHEALTAAHPNLPFDTMIRVTRVDDRRTIVVRVNDRMVSGPEHIIDLSGAAARKLGILESGVARVHIQALSVRSIVPSKALAVSRPDTRRAMERRNENDRALAARQDVSAGEVVASAAYTLQIGVFSTRDAASSFALGFETSWIAEVPLESTVHYRVYYSRFLHEKPARVAQKELWKRGHDSFLREISP